MRPSTLLLRALALVLVIAFLRPAIASADYKDQYREGIKAVDRKNWSEVIRRMQAAISENPNESARERITIYGMRIEPYLPHYYLALAYISSGNCTGALPALRESERQGAIASTPLNKNLQKLKERCPDTGPSPVPEPPVDNRLREALESARKEIESAQSAASALAKLREDSEIVAVWNRDPALAAREREITQKLAGARNRLGEGKLADATAAEEAAGAVRREFETLHSQLIRKRDQARELVAGLRREIQQSLRQADAALDRAPQADLPPEVSAGKTDLERRMAQARNLSSTVTVSQLEATRNELRQSLNRFERLLGSLEPVPTPPGPSPPGPIPPGPIPPGPQPAGPPPFLKSAVAAYFRGDYSRAAVLLERVNVENKVVAAQAMLFRGAARFALFVIGGQKDMQLRAKAVQDLREARRLNNKLSPDPKFFSPRFTAFFQDAQKSG